MNGNVIVFEDYIAESVAAAAMDFAASALTEATYRIINESGAITKDEVDTISNIYTKIITEAIDEFTPDVDELEQMKKTLEAAGYKVITADELEKQKAAEEAVMGATKKAKGEAPVTESVDLATKIAAKLEIL